MDLTGFVSVWEGENSGNLGLDSHGTNHLTNSNVTQTTGKVGSCGQFTAASSPDLGLADNASLSVGNIDFMAGAWVWMDSKPGASMDIIGHWESADLSWILFWYQTEDLFVFAASSDGSSAVLRRATSFGNPTTGAWNFILAWHDAAADTINIQVNNGAVDSSSFTGGVFNSSTVFRIGAQGNPAVSFWDGRIDQVIFAKRIPNVGDGDEFWNDGAGLSYAAMAGGGAVRQMMAQNEG